MPSLTVKAYVTSDSQLLKKKKNRIIILPEEQVDAHWKVGPLAKAVLCSRLTHCWRGNIPGEGGTDGAGVARLM